MAKQRGVGHESGRRWVLQDDIDSGCKDEITCDESVEIRLLKAENHRLTQVVALSTAAATFFARSRAPASDDHGVH